MLSISCSAVTPAKAGVHVSAATWIPAFAGMTALATSALATPVITCDRERYYEGETVRCTADTNAKSAQVLWSILGKNLKKEPLKPILSFPSPTGLRAVTPLELRIDSMEPIRVHLFPRNPRYWIAENEFQGKTILVRQDAVWVAAEFDALGIPYMLEKNSELQKLKRIDIEINDGTLQSLDRSDPWLRWELVQWIRKSGEKK